MMLPKNKRLKKKKDIEAVLKEGTTFADAFLVVKVKKSEKDTSRFAFFVPAKVFKKATERNRIKRVMANALMEVDPKEKKDFILIARKPVRSADYREIKRRIELLISKL